MKTTESVERTSGDQLEYEDRTVRKLDIRGREARTNSNREDGTAITGRDVGCSSVALTGWCAFG